MTKFLRVIGNMTWALAFALSVGLAFAHHGHTFDIALGVSILSLILSALGLLLARHCFKEGDGIAGTIGLAVWLAGALSFSVTEFGFWHASYKERHADYVQIKAAKERQEGLKTMAWETLKTGETRATSAEMKARIAAVQQSDIWATTKSCANATVPASRKFCGEYFDLVAELAKIEKLESIEAGFLAEKPDEKQKLANKVFAAADLIAETGLLNERQAATLVILIVAMVLMLARDLLPIGANPIRKPREALQPAKAPEATETPAVATPAIYEAPAQDWASREDIAGLHKLLNDMRAANIGPDHVPDTAKKIEQQFAEPAKSPTLSNVENEPNHPESPVSSEASGEIIPLALAGDEPDVIEAVMTKEAANVYDLLTGMPKPMPLEHAFGADVKIRREKTTRGLGSAVQWADECTEMDEDSDTSTTMVQIWPSYASWCSQNNFHPMDKKELSRKLSAHLKIPAGRKNSKRSGAGKVFRGLIVHMPVAEKARKIA